MVRVTKAKIAKKRHKKVLSSTKGHYGARSRLYKTAKQSHIKALQYAFRDRKNKKRRTLVHQIQKLEKTQLRRLNLDPQQMLLITMLN